MKTSTTRVRRIVTAHPWLSSGVAVVVVGGSVTGYLLTGHSSAQAQNGVISRLVAASIGTVRESVTATGTMTPADEQDVSFSSSAEVTSVRVAVGDKVKKGDVLGTIDNLSLKAALAEARSTLASAKATLAAAEDDDSTTAAQLSADRASVTTARHAVTAARAAVADATLRSPISGTVAEVNVAKGDQAAGSSAPSSNSDGSASSGDFVVIGMRKWTVSASVDDTEVGLVKQGQQARITTDNVSGTVFGVVSSVSVLSSSDSGSATYPVDIDVTGTPTGLHDGASANVEIVYHQVTNVLTVPSAAVHADPGGGSYVYVSSGGKKVRKDVTTGLASGGTTQIKSGLAEGDQVYLEIDTGSRPSGSTNGNLGQLVQNGNFPGGGVVIPGNGQVGNLPVTSGGGK
jgi:multidrug efflux pump subunit AcrA (membrane-fusion protein)